MALIPARPVVTAPANLATPRLEIAVPVSLPPDRIVVERASATVIGWFDTSEAVVTNSGSGDTGAGRLVASPAGANGSTEGADLAQRLASVLQAPLASLLAPDGSLDWPAPLRPFQQEGVSVLLERRELLLADDMGLGKTIQAAAAMRVLFHRKEVRRALIVAPASLLRQWSQELARWAPELKVIVVAGDPSSRGTLWRLPAHVRLVSYETLRGDVLELANSPVLREPWDLLVLDEAAKIKNRDTRVSLACKRIPRHRSWALTGTPLENQVEDLLSILEFLLAGTGTPVPSGPGPELRELLSRLQLRRRKADVLPELPPKHVIDVPIELGPRQRVAYDAAEREGIILLTEAGEAVTVSHVLELIMRLKQLCNVEPVSGESAKLDDVGERMRSLAAEGHRALIFSQFTDERYGVRAIERRLTEFHPLVFTGTMSPGQRSETVDRFTKDAARQALILSLRAGGVGLNLQAASYVFHLDRWWNPATEDQAESRAHRMGQEYPVTVYRYTCAGTVEERIAQRLEEKRRLFHEIVDDVSLDLRTSLTEKELFGLFGLSAPQRAQRLAGAATCGAQFGDMSGEGFEDWVGEGLSAAGYRVERTPASNDGGIDLYAVRADELGVETRLAVQCKNHAAPVGVSVIRELRGAVSDPAGALITVVACPAGFTGEARRFAERSGVRLWGRPELEGLTARRLGRPRDQREPGED